MPSGSKARWASGGAAAGAVLGAGWALGIAAGVLPAVGPALPGGLLASALAHAVGGAVLLWAGVLVGHNAMDGVREMVKQVAVWLGIVTLLPLAVWYGTSAVSSPPDWKRYLKTTTRLDERLRDAKEEAAKEKLRQEKDRLDDEREAAERVYYRHMFWVAYPIGLAAFVVGIFFPVQAVGAGLMFGGLSSLATGCYSYWDRMGDWPRFGSLVIALLIVFALGAWRFWSPNPTSRLAS